LELSPGDTVIAEEVIPLLDAAGQREMADRFVMQVVEHYESLCESHPKSALLHNNLAWATARCHRRLDVALSHAEKAVELDPDNAGYIDTLAEVCFHLGERDKAIHWSERAVALRPMGKSLQAQLARFRSAPLPTP
jgi:tetratricopeptide (TPR) repeat protein